MRWVKRVSWFLLAYVLGVFATVVVAYVVYLDSRPDLRPWHTARVESEFRAGSPAKTLAEYLAIEDAVFRELHSQVYDRVEERRKLNRCGPPRLVRRLDAIGPAGAIIGDDFRPAMLLRRPAPGDRKETAMARFVISPHFRLQEWVAEEKGYFRDEGLDYEFRDNYGPGDAARKHTTPDKVGAYQTFEQGRSCDVSGACHWTVNVAASTGHGKLYADAYSVSPAAVFVPPESPVRDPADLQGVTISVGHQSGSHYATIQALEQYMPLEDIKLSFADGLLFRRMELAIDRRIPAVSLFSGPYYFLEQLGFRKVIDTTFMMATMVTGSPDPDDIRKFFRALRRAQRDIDLRPELYTHHYRKEFPARFLDQVDTRRWGPGERIVFEPYTKEVFEASFEWIASHKIFPEGAMGAGRYEDSVVSLAA